MIRSTTIFPLFLSSLFCVAAILPSSPSLAAPGSQPWVFQGFGESQKKKESTRWTIEDWLGQKQKIRWMDYWLAMNTAPVNFESSLGVSQWSQEIKSSLLPGVTTDEKQSRANLALYYRILGLSAEFENLSGEYKAFTTLFNLRLIGTSLQSSQLTLHYGLRKFDPENVIDKVENQIAGATLTLYLMHVFGIEAGYRKIFESTNDNSVEVGGSQTFYGLFLELGLLRIYGKLLSDKLTFTPAATPAYAITTKGTELGVQLYF